MTTTSTQFTASQKTALRALLEKSAAQHCNHYTHNVAALDALSDEDAGDAGAFDRDLAVLAAQRARDTIDELEAALARLDDGTYGICESCGTTIPFERLEALPHSRHCVACPRPGAPFR